MSARDPGKTLSIFLNTREAGTRMRLALRVSVLLWAGTLTSWLTPADTALYHSIEANRTLQALHPLLELYSEWCLFVFYLPFLALFGLGILKKHALFRTVGLAYVLAQFFGSFLLAHLIKLGVGRPRPHAAHLQDAFLQATHFAQAIHSSFPSSHAVDAAVGAVFLGVLLRSRAASMLALAAAAGVALCRVLIGKHYMSDVLAGLALGAMIVAVVMHVFLLPRWRRIETAARQ